MYKTLSDKGLSVQPVVTAQICRIFLCILANIPATEHIKAFVLFLGLATKNEFAMLTSG
jgi:hypothetical protein